MRVQVFADRESMSVAAAAHAARALRTLLAAQTAARIVAATGASQLRFLELLCAETEIDWPRVEMFHLDEYVGLSIDHPASFRRYLLDRFINVAGVGRYHLLDGERDPAGTAHDIGRHLAAAPVDLAFVGIGENGHLAFNDPPADFLTDEPYLIVALDEACRRQQVGEGWFQSLEEVPSHAISMSIRQILASREIICIVPDARKAAAVKATLENPISPSVPASILRSHGNVTIYLDSGSASTLDPAILDADVGSSRP